MRALGSDRRGSGQGLDVSGAGVDGSAGARGRARWTLGVMQAGFGGGGCRHLARSAGLASMLDATGFAQLASAGRSRPLVHGPPAAQLTARAR